MEKDKRKTTSWLMFGIGVIAILIGAMTNLYDVKIGALIMLVAWIIGGALVFKGKEESPKPSEESTEETAEESTEESAEEPSEETTEESAEQS